MEKDYEKILGMMPNHIIKEHINNTELSMKEIKT